MTKLILSWDSESFTSADKKLLWRLIEDMVIDGVKTGHIADSIVSPRGVSLSSVIRLFVKDKCRKGAVCFKDGKIYDVGNTVVAAVKNMLSPKGHIDLLTIHPDISTWALREVANICRDAGTIALLTTALTDFTPEEYFRRFNKTPAQRAVQVATLALTCGISGIVCSGHELEALSQAKLLPDILTVVPGVRLVESDSGGQRRVVSPFEAALGGADYVVVGTPIFYSKTPYETAVAYRRNLETSIPH